MSDILGVLDQIANRYDPRKITIVLSGGEPLCYPGVFELGQRITSLGYPWGMVTNGLGWSRTKVMRAKAAGMRTVSVSLDGLETSHDWLRGRKGTFKKAVAAIQMLVDAAFLAKMDVITCVNKRNLGDLDGLHALLTRIGVPGWRLLTISPIGRAADNPELFLNAEEFHSLMARTTELRGREGVSAAFSECTYLGPHLERSVCDRYFFCRAGINIAGIMVNGDILACPNIDRRFRQGSIHSDSFVDVWEDGYGTFRDRRWMKTGECQDCPEWAMCQGNSFHLRDFDTGRTKLCQVKSYRLL
jgi:radical SAM protein with 4Fe4S-binding SPASM domain